MPMARSIDSDYIDLSLMGGFDIGIDFDGFEENVRKIMELPIKYLDLAHDKAVELIEDVHAMLWAPVPDGEVSNILHETFKNPSSSNVTGSSPTSVDTKLGGANAEVSKPASLVTVENVFTSCIDMNAHETVSDLTKNPENISSTRDHSEADDLCLLPNDTLTTEVYDSTTSKEIILWNPENSAKRSRLPEPTSITEDDYAPHTFDVGKVAEIDCFAHSDIPPENSGANYEEHIVLHSAKDPAKAAAHGFETVSHDLSADVSRCADDSTMCPDDKAKFVATRLRSGQESLRNDKSEASYAYLRQNTSFKKMLMRNLSSKLQWSKKQAVQQDVPPRSQNEDNLGYQLISSSDDLDDDWEVL